MKEGRNEFTQITITIIMKKLNAKKGILFFFICNSLYNLSLVGQTDFIVSVSIIGVGILGKVAVIDHNCNLAFVDHEEVDNDQDNYLVREQLVLEVDLVVED